MNLTLLNLSPFQAIPFPGSNEILRWVIWSLKLFIGDSDSSLQAEDFLLIWIWALVLCFLRLQLGCPVPSISFKWLSSQSSSSENKIFSEYFGYVSATKTNFHFFVNPYIHIQCQMMPNVGAWKLQILQVSYNEISVVIDSSFPPFKTWSSRWSSFSFCLDHWKVFKWSEWKNCVRDWLWFHFWHWFTWKVLEK